MQKGKQLSDGQMKALLETDQAEFASHKLRVRSGTYAETRQPNLLISTTFDLIETQIWAFQMYRKIARARARSNEWDTYFGVVGKLAYAEWSILRAFLAFKSKSSVRSFAGWLIRSVDGGATFLDAKGVEQIRAEIEAQYASIAAL